MFNFKSAKATHITTRILLLFAVVQFVVFLFGHATALGVGFTLLVLATLAPVLWFRRDTVTFSILAQAVLALLLSVLVWWRDDASTSLFALVLTIALVWTFLQETIAGHTPNWKTGLGFFWRWWCQFWYYSTVLPQEMLQFLPQVTFKKKFSWPRVSTKLPLGRIILGSIFALPVFGLLLLLFSAADASFAQALEALFIKWPDWFQQLFSLVSFKQLFDFIQKWTKDGIAFWLWFTAITPIPHTKENQNEQRHSRSYFVEKITAAIIIMVPFIAFISLQLHLLPTMLTSFRTGAINPALTIRESFGQLFMACAIGIGMALVLLKETTAANKKYVWLAIVTIGLVGEVILVSVNAGYRLWVYQFLHGFTVYRIWGGLLLVWLWATLIWVVMPLRKKVEHVLQPELFLYGLLSISGLVLVAGILNVHSLVMVKKPTVTNQIDWSYIHRNTSGDARHHYLAALGKVQAVAETCQQDGSVAAMQLSSQCAQEVKEAQDKYETLEQFDEYMFRQIKSFINYNYYTEYDGRDLILKHCQSVVDQPKPWWQRRGWDWHVEQLCQAWKENWQAVGPVYQKLLEKVSEDSTAAVKVLVITYGDSQASQFTYDQSNLASQIENASKPNLNAKPLVDYQITEIRSREKSQLPVSTYTYPDFNQNTVRYVNIQTIFDTEQVCDVVNQDKIDEVWVNAPGISKGAFGEGLGYSHFGVVSADHGIWSGGIPTSSFGAEYADGPPRACDETVAFAFFDSQSQVLQLSTIASRMSALAKRYNASAFEKFSEVSFTSADKPSRTEQGQPVWACGSPWHAPNLLPKTPGGNVYSGGFNSEATVLSDCADWNQDRSGSISEISCKDWDCSHSGFTNWWLRALTANMRLNAEASNKTWPNLWRAAVR